MKPENDWQKSKRLFRGGFMAVGYVAIAVLVIIILVEIL